MAFTALTAGQVDADSPLDETLMGLIRTNFDDLDAARVTNGNSHDHSGGDGATIGTDGVNQTSIATSAVGQGELAATTGSWSGSISGTSYAYQVLHDWSHIPKVGGSNHVNVYWGMEQPVTSSPYGASSGVLRAKAYNQGGSSVTGHITWIYHIA